jgi:hypothetical protein
MWGQFEDDGDDEWVDPEEEREAREVAIVFMWREGMLDEYVNSRSPKASAAARRLIAEAQRIVERTPRYDSPAPDPSV